MSTDLSVIFVKYFKKSLLLMPKILVLLILLLLTTWIIKITLAKIEKYLIKKAKEKGNLEREQEKRIETIVTILNKITTAIILLIGITLILGQTGVSIGPIVASMGIFGLAVGFGAQNLVRDIISGMFILIEDQVRVGDVAIVNGTGGLVEAINLRTIVLRDLSGVVHIFPNGTINTLSNMTKEWSGHVFNIGVAYKENVDKVMSIIKEVGEEMRNDPVFKEKIIQPIEIFGLDKFADSALVIMGRLKTKPIQQWVVGREFNRRIKIAFDKNGIEIPFPHRTLYFGEASRSFEVLLKDKIK